jgi:hypothetical protein
MSERLVSFKIAVLSKENKFDWPVNQSLVHYLGENKHPHDGTSGPFGWEKDEIEESSEYFVNFHDLCDLSNENYICYARPTQSKLQTWFRDVHGVFIGIDGNGRGKFRYHVYNVDETNDAYPKYKGVEDTQSFEFGTEEYTFDSYEDALEEGLIVSLNFIKSNKINGI